LDGQDDSVCPSSSPSGNVEDSTLQHSGDTCEDPYVLSLRHDEIRRLDELPVGVDMASRNSCMVVDELPMMSDPHFSSSHSPMLDTTHEDINGILDMVEEPCVGIVHKGHIDLHTEEERYGLELVDLTHTYQYDTTKFSMVFHCYCHTYPSHFPRKKRLFFVELFLSLYPRTSYSWEKKRN